MIVEAFFDTNILLYAGSSAPADSGKQRIAEELLLTVPFALSAQVLQEYIANALGKKALGLNEDNITAMLDALAIVEVLPITRELVIRSLQVRRRFQVSHWDASIIAAALELGCKILYTEDLNHDQDYGGVRAINPFI
ncbi:MAG: PIN domain-containing protein [Verrucomicrobiales bacterium]